MSIKEVEKSEIKSSPQREKFDGEMCIMDLSGDIRIIWDKDNDDEVDTARETFEKFKAKGYLAYKTDKEGNQGEVIKKFDSKAQKLIMVPQLAGGNV